MDDKKPGIASDDYLEIKPSKQGYFVTITILALIFAAIFLMVELAGFVVSDLETRVKSTIKETVDDLLADFEFTFESMNRGSKPKAPKGPGKQKTLTAYPKRDFEGGVTKLRMQSNGNSSGTFTAVRQNQNRMLVLKVTSLKPSIGQKRSSVTGLVHLGARLRTTKLNGAFFSVKSETLKKFDFSLWSYKNGRWYRHSFRGLEAGPEWKVVRVPLDRFSFEKYNSGTGAYLGSDSSEKPDFLFWVGWHIDSRYYPEGISGELQIDNLGFY